MTDTPNKQEEVVEREVRPTSLTMPNGDILECEYPKDDNWARSWTSRNQLGQVATGEQDWEVVEIYGLTAIANAMLDFAALPHADAHTLVNGGELRAHIAEQITHIEQRIKDGTELGASVWRIALEDVVRENRAILQLLPSTDREEGE